MENKLIVSTSPHVSHKDSTQSIMRDVIIALMPAFAVSIYVFGLRAVLVTAVSVLSCVVSEYAFRRIAKRSNTLSDLSAVVTGIILAFNLPATMPLWMVAIGGFVAIFIIKQLFGGIGDNFINPAIGARVVLFISFASYLSSWIVPFNYGSEVVTG
ncbi:MAG: RnfABCDGE type electron transport complex subunit D, partial [Clostridia bacterium]|nr:RnfABCDGE type electron transport complex subunit D [Clostridia bacterium]